MLNEFRAPHDFRATSRPFARQRRFSGKYALAAVLLGMALALPTASTPAQAQGASGALPPPSPMPEPNELELAKLIWSTMAAVDHANVAGNYSVLRDLSAPGFQMNNDAARLAKIFETLRASNVDLSNTMLLAPTYQTAPVIMSGNVLHVKGFFGLRPTAIGFDLYYQWLQGRWRLYGVSIVPAAMANVQPGGPPPPAQPPAQPGRRETPSRDSQGRDNRGR